jgi:hypothetical protein
MVMVRVRVRVRVRGASDEEVKKKGSKISINPHFDFHTLTNNA